MQYIVRSFFYSKKRPKMMAKRRRCCTISPSFPHFIPMRLSRTLMAGALAAAIALTAAAPAFAVDAPRDRATGQASGRMANMDGTCMAAAVTARDTTISAALAPVTAAIQTRGTALAAAWKLTDPVARKAAVKAANTAFNGTWKTFNTARKNAWNTFKTAAKACKVSPADAGAADGESGM